MSLILNEFIAMSPSDTLDASPFDLNVRLESVTCPHCRRGVFGSSRTSLLGFRRYSCWRCLSDFSYPLQRRYRVAYWVVLAGGAAAMGVMHGKPNAFLAVAGIPLLLDAWRMLRRR